MASVVEGWNSSHELRAGIGNGPWLDSWGEKQIRRQGFGGYSALQIREEEYASVYSGRKNRQGRRMIVSRYAETFLGEYR
jgi:hypothetical protein